MMFDFYIVDVTVCIDSKFVAWNIFLIYNKTSCVAR